MKSLLPVLTGLCCLLQSGLLPAEVNLHVGDPWVREAPPSASVLAAYMTLHNPGPTPVEITSISSPDFARGELHRTVVEDGVARMLPVGQLVIPASDQATLEPGGMHLMLYEPRRVLRAGDSVTLIIEGSDDLLLTFPAAVKRDGSDTGHHHHHHQH